MTLLDTFIRRYRNNPLAFVEEVLRVKPTWQQKDVLLALPSARNIAIKSGHGTGKTALMTWIVLWYMMTHPLCRIPITAPTMHQLVDVFWAELSYWLAKSDILNRFFEKTASKLMPRSEKYKKAWFATLVSASKPENMQGFHGHDLLFIVDEASGISDAMFEVIDAALTNEGARLIMAGNPTRRSGYFYRIFQSDDDVFVKFTFSSLESPLVSKAWIKKMKKMYGEDSDVFRIRVLGEFPSEEGSHIIPVSWIELAMINEQLSYGDIVVGVDVARGGSDKTAIVVANGYVVEHVFTYSKLDTVEVAEEVHKIATIYNAKRVVIENVGFGAGVLDVLLRKAKQEKAKYELHQFVPKAAAHNKAQYSSAMSEAWWHLRSLFKPTATGFPLIKIPNDDLVLKHLSIREYAVDNEGRLKLVDKLTLHGKYGYSPDIGDAMAMAFYPYTQRAKLLRRGRIPTLKRGESEWEEILW